MLMISALVCSLKCFAQEVIPPVPEAGARRRTFNCHPAESTAMFVMARGRDVLGAVGVGAGSATDPAPPVVDTLDRVRVAISSFGDTWPRISLRSVYGSLHFMHGDSRE